MGGGDIAFDPKPVVPEGFVDFGLPSGTLWAQYNLGVDPTDLDSAADWVGNYYQYGDTVPLHVEGDVVNPPANPSTYKWNGTTNLNAVTKYCTTGDFEYWEGNGSPDNKVVLDPIDDAATQTNGMWSIPTMEQMYELVQGTINEPIYNYQGINNLNGRKIIKRQVLQQGFKNATIYSPIVEDGGEITDLLWREISAFSLEEINELSGSDFRNIVYRDANYTQLAEYGVDYQLPTHDNPDYNTFIFLPYTGMCLDRSILHGNDEEEACYLSTATIHYNFPGNGNSRSCDILYAGESSMYVATAGRYYGRVVRPVITPTI